MLGWCLNMLWTEGRGDIRTHVKENRKMMVIVGATVSSSEKTTHILNHRRIKRNKTIACMTVLEHPKHNQEKGSLKLTGKRAGNNGDRRQKQDRRSCTVSSSVAGKSAGVLLLARKKRVRSDLILIGLYTENLSNKGLTGKIRRERMTRRNCNRMRDELPA